MTCGKYDCPPTRSYVSISFKYSIRELFWFLVSWFSHIGRDRILSLNEEKSNLTF